MERPQVVDGWVERAANRRQTRQFAEDATDTRLGLHALTLAVLCLAESVEAVEAAVRERPTGNMVG
jgi:hypothetical protein